MRTCNLYGPPEVEPLDHLLEEPPKSQPDTCSKFWMTTGTLGPKAFGICLTCGAGGLGSGIFIPASFAPQKDTMPWRPPWDGLEFFHPNVNALKSPKLFTSFYQPDWKQAHQPYQYLEDQMANDVELTATQTASQSLQAALRLELLCQLWQNFRLKLLHHATIHKQCQMCTNKPQEDWVHQFPTCHKRSSSTS